jgi:homoserine kinase
MGYAVLFSTPKTQGSSGACTAAALAVLTAQQLACVRSWGAVKILELAMPGEKHMQNST